jgi:hypothetical protein
MDFLDDSISTSLPAGNVQPISPLDLVGLTTVAVFFESISCQEESATAHERNEA